MSVALNLLVCQDKGMVETFLRMMEAILLGEERIPYIYNKEWYKQFPKCEAVYLFRDTEDTVCYVGESACLRKRMADLYDTRRHTLRRNIAEINFSHLPGYIKPTSNRKGNPDTESRVTAVMESMTMSYLPVRLGRSEFEEYMIERYNPMYNIKTKRL